MTDTQIAKIGKLWEEGQLADRVVIKVLLGRQDDLSPALQELVSSLLEE